MTARVLLVGWDAADWKVIHPLMDAGWMPNLQRLVERGVMGNLTTLSPVLSPMLWTSIATGKRPFKHGVHGFTEPTPDGRAVRPVTSRTRTTRALWNILTLAGKTSHVVGWWPSHPAEPIRGSMVSNRYQRAPQNPTAPWPMPPGTVHPARLAPLLEELRLHPAELGEEHIRLFVPNAHKVDQSVDRRLDSILRIIADCSSIHAAATHLMEDEPWDFAAVYYDAIDHFGHGFMKYHPPKQESVSDEDFDLYSQVISAGYVYHDMMLGRLLDLAGDDVVTMLISDHGFHPDHLRPTRMPLEPAGPAIEHRDQGVFVMAGPGVKRDHLISGASLLDIAPTVLTLFGLPVGDDMDGRPVLDAFERPPEIGTIPSWDLVGGDAGRHGAEAAEDPDEARETLRQLVALGYIEAPDDDAEKAVAQCRRELDYNLAMSYLDADLHPKAAPLFASLYAAHPLEFRFGVRLALCLQAMQQPADMATVVEHLNENSRRAAERSQARLREIAAIARERRKAGRGTKAPQPTVPEPVDMGPAVLTDASEANARALGDLLFSQAERQCIKTLRSIARGNAETLDILAAGAATSRRDHRAALAILERVGASPIAAPGVRLQLGHAYLRLRRSADAAAQFAAAAKRDPENPHAQLGLCRVALREGRDRDALVHAKAAIGLRYHLPVGHLFLGMAQSRLGLLPEAIASLGRGIEQNPNFAEAHRILARVHDRRGDASAAASHRLAAQALRTARRALLPDRPVFALPALESIDIDAALPEWPAPPVRLAAPLRLRPIARRDGAAGRAFVTIVSGLPRSGTSMAMQMLAAGGLPAMTDGIRRSDANNPRGYLEFERVTRLHRDNTWLEEARGRALKVVTPLLQWLPQDCDYRVIHMERDLTEVVASQARMLDRLQRDGAGLERDALCCVLGEVVLSAHRLLAAHAIPVLSLDYAATVHDPASSAAAIAAFLGCDLDMEAMERAVDPGALRHPGTREDRSRRIP